MRRVREYFWKCLTVSGLLWGMFPLVYAQAVIGRIVNETGQGVMAANVWFQGLPGQGTLTDMSGSFSLPIPAVQPVDTLLAKYPGYALARIPLATGKLSDTLKITLMVQIRKLDEVSIVASTPVSGDFSVVTLRPLDIYLNPLAAADPLRALTSLSASTNTDESANPTLRGSASDLSRVVVNGVPIYQPVRNSQINGLGNFSLFNTEWLEAQYVYPSNPPLTYGNTSAGLVEIETREQFSTNSRQLSTSLASVGVSVAQCIQDKAWIQAYSNLQRSEAFIALNRANLPELRDFRTLDAGIHLFVPLGKRLTVKWLGYGITEGYRVQTQVYTHQGEATGSKQRTFHTAQIRYEVGKGYIMGHAGFDISQANYRFGNIRSDQQDARQYLSLAHKGFVGSRWRWQAGISWDHWRRQVADTGSQFYFALAPEAPTVAFDTVFHRPIAEAYAFGTFEPTNEWELSAGIRQNLRLAHQSDYLSFQGAAKYQPSRRHQYLLSAGRYHSYAVPSFLQQTQALIQASQIALDYQYERGNTLLRAAVFAKRELGPQTNGILPFLNWIQAYGLETSWEQALGPNWTLAFANVLVRQDIRFDPNGSTYRGVQDLPFFLKGSLQWGDRFWGNWNVSGLYRPGTWFNPIEGGQFVPEAGDYEPRFERIPHSQRLPDYLNISFGWSRIFPLETFQILGFLNINNLPNRLNPRDLWYNATYDHFQYAPYSRRNIYFGLIWQWE